MIEVNLNFSFLLLQLFQIKSFGPLMKLIFYFSVSFTAFTKFSPLSHASLVGLVGFYCTALF